MLVAISQPLSQEAQEEAARHKVSTVMLNTSVSSANLQALAAKVNAGEVRPFVGRTYLLSAAAQAWRDVHSQHIEGKIVFAVSSQRARTAPHLA